MVPLLVNGTYFSTSSDQHSCSLALGLLASLSPNGPWLNSKRVCCFLYLKSAAFPSMWTHLSKIHSDIPLQEVVPVISFDVTSLGTSATYSCRTVPLLLHVIAHSSVRIWLLLWFINFTKAGAASVSNPHLTLVPIFLEWINELSIKRENCFPKLSCLPFLFLCSVFICGLFYFYEI